MNAEIEKRGGLIKVRALDIRPNQYALPCEFPGKRFVLNPICIRRWMDDGERISFMMDTHNFFFAKANEEVEVVAYAAYANNPKLQARCLKQDAELMNRTRPRRIK